MLESLSGDAADIMPTFTSPADVDAHREAVNGQHQGLNAQISNSSVSPDFKAAWGNYLQNWLNFYNANKSTSWITKSFSAKSMYEQIDQFATQVADWAQKFQSAGGNLQGSFPSIADKPSEVPSLLAGTTGLVVAIGAVAAIVVLGPKIRTGE